MKKFRGEIFDLCKILKSNTCKEFELLRHTMSSLQLSNNNASEINLKHDIFSNGVRLNSDFYGILVAFEKRLTVFDTTKSIKTELNKDEFESIAFGNSLVNVFFNMCLTEIYDINPAFAKAMHPYSFLIPLEAPAPSFEYDMSAFQVAVDSFKHSSVYESVFKSNALQVLSGNSEKTAKELIQILYRDIIMVPMEKVSDDIAALLMRSKGMKNMSLMSATDAMSLISFKLLALREMLSNAARLIYCAILGIDLTIIDESSLINIEKNSSNLVYSYKTILIQGIVIKPLEDLIKSMLLLTIDYQQTKIHEFGTIKSYTVNFNQTEGGTTKISYCLVDDDLNPIFNLTN